MTGVDRANGHEPAGISPLFHPALADAPRPDPEKLDYDLNRALSAVVPLQARAPEDAFSASYLGTEREGNAVLISEDAWLGALFADQMTSLKDYVRCSAKLRSIMGPHVAHLLNNGLSVQGSLSYTSRATPASFPLFRPSASAASS